MRQLQHARAIGWSASLLKLKIYRNHVVSAFVGCKGVGNLREVVVSPERVRARGLVLFKKPYRSLVVRGRVFRAAASHVPEYAGLECGIERAGRRDRNVAYLP